jgi:hypothetical protein
VWASALAPLIDRPGDWALVRTYDRKPGAVDIVRSLRQAARGLGTVRIPPGRWEFTQRRVRPGVDEWGVWARYLGED